MCIPLQEYNLTLSEVSQYGCGNFQTVIRTPKMSGESKQNHVKVNG